MEPSPFRPSKEENATRLYHLVAKASAIFFDCDGVLVDTEHLKERSWNDALSQYGTSLSHEEYLSFIGYSSEHILGVLNHSRGNAIPSAVIAARESRYQSLRLEGVEPLESGTGLLRFAAFLQKPIAVASGDFHSTIRQNLALAQVSDLVRLCVSGEDDIPPGLNKPDPAIYLAAAEKLFLSDSTLPRDRSRYLVVEDTPAGATAGLAAGMNVIAVANSYTRSLPFPDAVALHLTTEALEELLGHPRFRIEG